MNFRQVGNLLGAGLPTPPSVGQDVRGQETCAQRGARFENLRFAQRDNVYATARRHPFRPCEYEWCRPNWK